MPKIANRPLIKLPRIRIWEDDYDYLKQLFGGTEIGFAGAVRSILSEYVSIVRSRANEHIDQEISTETAPIKLNFSEEVEEFLKK